MFESILHKSPRVLGSPEFALLLVIVAIYFVWYIWRHRRGFLVMSLMTLPIFLLLLIRAIEPLKSPILVIGAAIAFGVFAGVDICFDSRRRIFNSRQLVSLTDAVATLTVLCIVFPFAVLRRPRLDDTTLAVAILCVASVSMTMYARWLILKYRPDVSQSFQFPIWALLLLTTILAVAFVSPFVMALSIFFFGAGLFYGGASLIPATRQYRSDGVSEQIARQQRTGVVALLNGIAVMFVGVANACVVSS